MTTTAGETSFFIIYLLAVRPQVLQGVGDLGVDPQKSTRLQGLGVAVQEGDVIHSLAIGHGAGRHVAGVAAAGVARLRPEEGVVVADPAATVAQRGLDPIDTVPSV